MGERERECLQMCISCSGPGFFSNVCLGCLGRQARLAVNKGGSLSLVWLLTEKNTRGACKEKTHAAK